MFENFKTGYAKKSFRFNKNVGRHVATQKSVLLASGKWLLLVRSNVVLDENIISVYSEKIASSAVAHENNFRAASCGIEQMKLLITPPARRAE